MIRIVALALFVASLFYVTWVVPRGAKDADPDLRVQWQAMEFLWDKLRPLIVEFRRALVDGRQASEPTAPRQVIALDNQSLLTQAHHRACIAWSHPPHAPCVGYDGAWSPLAPATDIEEAP